MARAINFNAGPATLPVPALERAQKELLDLDGTGMSVIEHSHRGAAYEAVHKQAIALTRELYAVPDSHDVLFLQGGASLQFAMLPMNFIGKDQSADYVLTGVWSKKAISEAKLVGKTRVAATTEKDGKFTRVPLQSELDVDANAAYVHITTNNTIFGTQWHYVPDVGRVPLVADMSSDIGWRPFDVSKYALLYAGAQKNIGPSGLVLVILDKQLMARGRKDIPAILRYSTHAENESLYNTPPTFSIYLLRNVLEVVKETGGLAALERRNREKAELLYGAIDAQADVFRCPVEKASRSVMNVVFTLPTPEIEEAFLSGAKQAGMVGLKGHRSAGGIRVSTYNAVPVEWVRTLVDFMRDFARRA